MPQQAGSALVWKSVQLGGAKLVFLVRILVLGRLLAPDDFGLLAISTITVGFLLRITDFGMVPALVQRQSLERRHYDTAWTINLVRALAVAVTVSVGATLFARMFAEPRATDLIRVLALRPVLDAGASIRVADLTRDLRFRALTTIRLAEAVVNTVVSIALARPLGVWALVFGPLAGSTTYMAASYLIAPHRPRLSFERRARSSLMRFGRWIFLTGLFGVLGNLILQMTISRKLGVEELGLYFLASSLAFIPSQIAQEVTGEVAFPVFSRLQTQAWKMARAFRSLVLALSGVIIPASLLLIVLAPTLVSDVLGPRWQGTEQLIRILACVNVVGLLGDAVTPALRGAGRPEWQTATRLLYSFLLIVSVWELSDRYGVEGAGLAWLFAAAGTQLLSAAFVRRIIVDPFAGLAIPTLSVVASALAGGAAAWAVDAWLSGPVGLGAAAVLAVAVTASMLWTFDRHLELGLSADLSRTFPPLAAWLRQRGIEMGP